MNDTKPLSKAAGDRVGALIALFLASWMISAGPMELHAHHRLAPLALFLILFLRSLIELPVVACIALHDELLERFGPYALYLAFGSPLIVCGLGAGAAVNPDGPWVAIDAAVRFLTVVVPLAVWALCQSPPIGSKQWRRMHKASKASATSRPAYVPPAYDPPGAWPLPPVHVPTRLEKELAAIEEEARTANLPADLVEAEKERARAEFGSRNGIP